MWAAVSEKVGRPLTHREREKERGREKRRRTAGEREIKRSKRCVGDIARRGEERKEGERASEKEIVGGEKGEKTDDFHCGGIYGKAELINHQKKSWAFSII